MERNDAGRPDGLFGLPVRRPVGVTMVVLAVSVFGWVSLGRLPLSLLPDLSYPTVTVRTEYPGAAPEDVEERISERLQEAVAVLSGLESYTSISRAGVSDVVLEFAWGTNLSLVTSEIRERIDRALLPDDATEPLILRYDPSLDPILRIGCASDGRALRELRTLLEEEVERELETLPGVAAIKIRGGLEKRIAIELSPAKLRLHKVDILTVSQRLAAENVNLAAGRLVEGETEYVVRTLGEFTSPADIEDLIIIEQGDAPIRLRDLGQVRVSARERDVITRVDGRESVEIELYQEAGANLVDVATRVKETLLGTPEQRAYVARIDRGETVDPRPELREVETALEDADDLGFLKKAELEAKKKRLQKELATWRRMESFLARRLPEDLEFRVLTDPSTFVESALDEVRGSAITGGLLAVLVLFLFLRRLAPTLIVALSIPLSVIATFAPFDFAGITLNVMSLGGLALGVGMLVDNSIVVLESITRCREEGDDRSTAAVRGVREVGSAVFASTLTTVAVFFPIVFVQGLAGRIFRDQALAVVLSLLASLGVALFFIPTLAAWTLQRGGPDAEPKPTPGTPSASTFAPLRWAAALRRFVLRIVRGVLFGVTWLLSRIVGGFFLLLAKILSGPAWLLNRALEALRRVYGPLCTMSVRTPVGALVVCLVALGLSAMAFLRFGSLGTQLLPPVHQGELIAKVALPVDTPVERTDETARTLSRSALDLPGISWGSAASGVSRDDVADSDEGAHTLELHLHLNPTDDLVAVEERLSAQLRALVQERPEVSGVRIERPSLFRLEAPLQVQIHGTDLDVLQALTTEVTEKLRALGNLTEVQNNFSRGNSEVLVRFDRDALHRRGIRLNEAADRLRNSIQGDIATRYADVDRKIDVVVRIDPLSLDSLPALSETSISAPGQPEVPLRTVAELVVEEGPSEIRQIRGDRVGVVTARPDGFDIGGASAAIADVMNDLDLPRGMHWEFGGQSKESSQAIDSLVKALLLAVFLVYLVMAAQFESFVQPLIILLSIPLATVGVIFTLDALGWPVSVVVLLGAILLAGIVVNNAILLLDAINRRRRAGQARTEAIVEACQLRLRPILMTTTTTVLALIPLTGLLGEFEVLEQLPVALGSGEGTELRAPMAVTVIAGLLSSTLLTLVVIPAIYSLVDRAGEALRSMLRRPSTSEA